MTTFLNSTLGVTGASGHLGRRVVELLLEAGAPHVVAITRQPGKLADLAKRGADVRQGSFADAAGLAGAFEGATKVLLISSNSSGDAAVEHHRNAIEAARAVGAQRLRMEEAA